MYLSLQILVEYDTPFAHVIPQHVKAPMPRCNSYTLVQISYSPTLGDGWYLSRMIVKCLIMDCIQVPLEGVMIFYIFLFVC